MPIKDEAGWAKCQENNKDGYGKAIVDVAREVMRALDTMPEGPLTVSASDMICQADEAIQAGGITGFMAGAAASIVSGAHTRGDEFRRSWNLGCQIGTEGERANETGGVLNPAIVSIG